MNFESQKAFWELDEIARLKKKSSLNRELQFALHSGAAD